MRLKRFGITTVIGAIPMLTLCVFTPLTLYAGNSDELSVAFQNLVASYLPYVALITVILGLPGLFLDGDRLAKYRAILAALAVLAWLQGNLFVWDYGEFDGRSISWLTGVWHGIFDAAVWIALLTMAAKLKRLAKPLIFAAVATCSIQIVTAIGTAMTATDDLFQDRIVTIAAEDSQKVFDFSATKNVVHIVMDGFQTDIFQSVLDAEDGNGLTRELTGFTLFENNLGVYPYTELTIPALLAGKTYRNDEPVDQFVSSALEGPTILRAAVDAGYEVDIAAMTSLANAYARAHHTNVYGITLAGQSDSEKFALVESAKLMDLALFRTVPHFVKALVHRDDLWVFQAYVGSRDHRHLQYFSDLSFLSRMAQSMTATRSTPVYKMLHLFLVHRPTVGNAQCEFEGRRPTTRANVTAQATCAFTNVMAVLRRMKEVGIYDSSLIVLMADHGAWVPVIGFEAAGVDDSPINATTVAMATPVLAIKPPGARDDFAVSTVPTSISDLPATLAGILNLPADFPGMSIVAIGPDEQRVRSHLIYGYGRNAEAPEYLYPMTEFEVRGDPYDAGSWRQTGRHAPPAD